MWSQGIELELVGGNDRDRFVPRVRELSNSQSRGDGVGSLRKQLGPDAGCVEQRMKGPLLELLQMESEHWLDLDDPWTLAGPETRGGTAQCCQHWDMKHGPCPAEFSFYFISPLTALLSSFPRCSKQKGYSFRNSLLILFGKHFCGFNVF